MSSTHNYNWSDFINFSEELLNNVTLIKCNKEAIYRTICNRAYYGIFKLIEDFCNENNIQLPETDERGKKLTSHKKIKYYLSICNDELYRLFSSLLTYRISADYRKFIKITDQAAKISIEKAKRAKVLFDRDKENWK